MPSILAYYCSGHGYGHATRVSAFARHLLAADPHRPTVYLVSSAPEHVFADSIAAGAHYRYAEIDPVIVQPLAYRVDRQRSLQGLKDFLAKKDVLLERERQWLLEINATAVLSDAAFLACLAAKSVGIPSILVTNFTFDSVYSYLATPILDSTVDRPVSPSDLAPLVHQIHSGYLCADLLLLLPGHIPIPSFFPFPPLPSPNWINPQTNRFQPQIASSLNTLPHRVRKAPLLVRPPTESPSVYTLEGRSRLLRQIGVPLEWHDPQTKILVVSFGGQVFHRPQSRSILKEKDINVSVQFRPPPSRIATPSHIWIPGAPPASKPTEYFPDDTPSLLPDSSWIAIVCGVSKEQWKGSSELPERFFVAPKEVYMPDVTAIADVLLGKLGYGTVSECVDACTPFVYVSRPLFIEEHGLRLLLEREGVGIELSRQAYEGGDWTAAVEEAALRGAEGKARKRREMAGGGCDGREEEARAMARDVLEWIEDWHD